MESKLPMHKTCPGSKAAQSDFEGPSHSLQKVQHGPSLRCLSASGQTVLAGAEQLSITWTVCAKHAHGRPSRRRGGRSGRAQGQGHRASERWTPQLRSGRKTPCRRRPQASANALQAASLPEQKELQPEVLSRCPSESGEGESESERERARARLRSRSPSAPQPLSLSLASLAVSRLSAWLCSASESSLRGSAGEKWGPPLHWPLASPLVRGKSRRTDFEAKGAKPQKQVMFAVAAQLPSLQGSLPRCTLSRPMPEPWHRHRSARERRSAA